MAVADEQDLPQVVSEVLMASMLRGPQMTLLLAPAGARRLAGEVQLGPQEPRGELN